jgi:glutaredoxin
MYTMITRNDCKYCDKAKALLKSKNINFTTYNVEEGSSKWVLSLMKEANIKTVPQIFASNGSLVGGYRDLESLVEFIGGKEY